MAFSPQEPPAEPLTRGIILHSMTAAIRELWGDGASTTGPDFAPLRWYPTRYIVEWNEAMMDGPSRGNEQAFRRTVARSMDLSFGRVRRVFLSFATPTLLAERATRLWKHDHTHGLLTVDTSQQSDGRARVTLAGHPFVATARSRIAIAEALRHVLSLSRASNVRESHAMSGDALAIAFTWDP
jgi:hypothetical protein